MALFRCGGGVAYDLPAGYGYFDGSFAASPSQLPVTLGSSYGHGGIINVKGFSSLSFTALYDGGMWGIKANGEIENISFTSTQANTLDVTDYDLVTFTSTQAANWAPTISLS